MSKEEIKKLKKEGVKFSPCVYLCKTKAKKEIDGEFGGWPRLPDSIDWPELEGAPIPFLGWLNLDRLSDKCEEINATGFLLIFQHSDSDPNALVHLSAETFTTANPRKLAPTEAYYENGPRPETGECFQVARIKAIEGEKASLNDLEMDDDDLWEEICERVDQLGPKGKLARIGGHMGAYHDSIVESAANHLFTQFQKEPEPEKWTLESLIDFDFSSIINRILNVRTFLIEHQPEIRHYVEQAGTKWDNRYQLLIGRLEQLEKRFGKKGKSDPEVLGKWIHEMQQAHYALGDSETPVYGEALIAIDNYTPTIDPIRFGIRLDKDRYQEIWQFYSLPEEILLVEGSQPKKPSIQHRLTVLNRKDYRDNPISDAALIKEMNVIIDRLETDVPTINWNDLIMILSLIGSVKSRMNQINNKNTPQSAPKQEQLTRQQIGSSFPWLVIYSKGEWTWGDCEHRIYLSNKQAIGHNDFSNHYLTIDHAS